MGKPSDLFRPDRYRSEARLHAGRSVSSTYNSPTTATSNSGGPILPLHNSNSNTEAGGLNEKHDGRGAVPGSSGVGASGPLDGPGPNGYGDGTSHPGALHHDNIADNTSPSVPPPAPPPVKSEDASNGNSTLEPSTDGGVTRVKPKWGSRIAAGSKRFVKHTKGALTYSWANVLLIFVPLGIIVEAVGLSPSIVFAMNAIAIIPLAGLLSHATEAVASRMGDTLGALLNVSFGNAVELIIFIIALVKNEIAIVQASLLGSILSNLLLILGMAFLLGGLRFREQIYNSTVTQMSACLLSLSVTSLLLPTAFHASFNTDSAANADAAVLKVSRGTSVVLLLVYVLYLLFQLKSHAYMYESTPQEVIDEESHPGVLADIMNYSSSSDDSSSSSDSTDSDTSGSGSIITKGRRIRNKFMKRRRRKSSASISSTANSSIVHSALSSPSTTERQGNYWEHQVSSHEVSRRASGLGVIASGDEADVDNEAGTHSGRPRIRDFVEATRNDPVTAEGSKSPERRRSKKKHKRHVMKKHRHGKHPCVDDEKTEQPEPVPETPAPKVGFVEDAQVMSGDSQQPPGRLAFNMRQLSSYTPGFSKMLSNTVFTSPPPIPEPVRRPAQPVRARSTGLRRTNSLPDRLSQQASAPTPGPIPAASEPLPPFRHQRAELRRPTTQDAELDDDDAEGKLEMSRTAAVVLLLISTALVAVCAEFMVDAIPEMIASSNINQAFVGLILLPIVSNAAEHVTAVTVATKNKMDLAISVAVGSSIQIALFVTPIVVLLGWILHSEMSLYFNLFETVSLFVTCFVVNFLVLDGRSNYLEGSLLIAAYVIIALGAFFYPSGDAQSLVGGGAGNAD